MASFPILRTGAVAQYPLERDASYSTAVTRFMDGNEQRYRSYASRFRRWVIRLDGLDEGEVAAVDAFFSTQTGAAGAFAFTDPVDGTAYANCSIEQDSLSVRYAGPSNGRTEIVIRENKG